MNPYWVIDKHLEKGLHQYQFVIDDNILICDPYAQQVEYENNNPVPKAGIEVGRDIYRWKYDDWRCPNLKDLVIYEMHIGDFSPQGTFRKVTERLDYLKKLGINAIEFMPLYESAVGDYWGYKPTYYFSPRRSFGSFWDIIEMIDYCHGNGIAVILDLVIAHTDHSHPFNIMYPYEQSPWYGSGLGEKNQFGLPTFDYSKDPPNGFVRDIEAYWLKDFHVDGFRYDYLAGIGSKEGKGLPSMMNLVREIRPEAFLIGECLPENPDLVNNSGIGAVWHTRSRLALTSLLVQTDIAPYSWTDFASTVQAFDPKTQDYNESAFMINYIESYDDKRLMFMLRQSGFNEEISFKKCRLAAAILTTLPGQPMLFAGQEIGESLPVNQNENKIDWNKLDLPKNKILNDYFSQLCRLRHSRSSLRNSNFKFTLIDSKNKLVVYQRASGADQVVVALNFSDNNQNIPIEFPSPGNWHEFDSNRIFSVNKSTDCRVETCSASIFISGVS